MIKQLFLFISISLCAWSCSNEDKVIITGKIQNATKNMVYLQRIDVDNVMLIDSVKMGKSGTFKFKTPVQYPTFFSVKIGDNQPIMLVGSPKEEIAITGKEPNITDNYWVDGSEGSLLIKVLNFQLNRTVREIDSLKNQYAQLPADEAIAERRAEIRMAIDTCVVRQVQFSRDFILKHATSLVSYYALYQKLSDGVYVLDPFEDLHSYKVVASSLNALYPESPYALASMNHLDKIQKSIQNYKLKQLIDNSENQLPRIALPNVNGDTVQLAALKGKYILLDFTTLDAQDSRAYVNQMKGIYNKYKNQGLEIYMVCLSKDEQLWKNSVRAFDIPWKVVYTSSEHPDRSLSQWNIQQIPANYIINPKYEIVGKNLSGRRLDDRLKDVIK